MIERLGTRTKLVIATSRLFLIFEELGKAVFWPLLYLTLFTALWIAGFYSIWLGVLFWFGLAVLSWAGFCGFRPPDHKMLLARIERENHLSHRPLSSFDDTSATPDKSAYFRNEKIRQSATLKRLRPIRPLFSFSNRDPYALRILIFLLLLLSVTLNPTGYGEKIKQGAFPFPSLDVKQKQNTLAVEILPPPYTDQRPLSLNEGRRKPLPVIQGSRIRISLQSRLTPSLKFSGQTVQFPKKDIGDNRTLEVVIPETDFIRVSALGWPLFNQKVKWIADKPPQVDLTGSPIALPHGRLQIPLRLSDDFGIRKLTLRGILPVGEQRPLFGKALYLETNMNVTTNGHETTIKPVFDGSGHEWAGRELLFQIEVEDFAGNTAQTQPFPFLLPQRQFQNTTAASISDIRNGLLQYGLAYLGEALSDLDAILSNPREFNWDARAALLLTSAIGRMAYDPALKNIDTGQRLLWQAALGIEDGTLPQTRDEFQKALADLQNGLQNPDMSAQMDEMMRLLSQFRDSLMKHIQALQPVKDTRQNLPASQQIDLSSLDNLLNQMAKDLRTGDQKAIQEKMNILQQLAEMLNGPIQSGAPKDVQDMMQDMKALQSAIDDQQKLLHKTKLPSTEMKRLSKDQTKIESSVSEISKKSPGAELTSAQKNMHQSALALNQNAKDMSVAKQEAALHDLQAAREKLQTRLQKRMQDIFSLSAPPASGTNSGSARGPLDLSDDTVRVPSESKKQKIDRIFDILRQRSGDLSRPQAERDYYKRLLKQW